MLASKDLGRNDGRGCTHPGGEARHGRRQEPRDDQSRDPDRQTVGDIAGEELVGPGGKREFPALPAEGCRISGEGPDQGEPDHAHQAHCQDVHDEIDSQDLAGRGGIAGCKVALDRDLVRPGRAGMPEEHREQDPHEGHSFLRVVAPMQVAPVARPLPWPPLLHPAELPGDKQNGQQGSTKEDAGLDHVGKHHRAQSTEAGVDDGHHGHHGAHRGSPRSGQAHQRDQDLVGRSKDDHRHPEQPERNEEKGSQEANTASELLLEDLVGGGDPELHEAGNHEPAHQEQDQREGHHPGEIHGAITDHLPGISEVGNGAQERGEERQADCQWLHAPPSQVILFRAACLPAEIEPDRQHAQRIQGDHGPVRGGDRGSAESLEGKGQVSRAKPECFTP